MSILITTRARDDAAKDIAAFAAAGITALAAPMLEIRATRDIALPADSGFDAIAFTSRHAAAILKGAHFRALPCYCVGAATAEVARAHGYRNIITGDGDGAALAKKIQTAHAQKPFNRVLWPAGKHNAFDLAAALASDGIAAQKIIVYEAVKTDSLPDDALDALKANNVRGIAVHAARAGENLTRLLAAHDIDRAAITLIAISARVAGFCGGGWHAIRIAEPPAGEGMHAAAISVMRGAG